MARARSSSLGQWNSQTASLCCGDTRACAAGVRWQCGTWAYYALRDVMDMGQQMGYHSVECNWPKVPMNIPIGAGIVAGAKMFHLFI